MGALDLSRFARRSTSSDPKANEVAFDSAEPHTRSAFFATLR